MVILYLFTFPNGKYYVGRTKNSFDQRLTEHKTRVTNNYQHPLYFAFNKYGWENVSKQILEQVSSHEEAINKELDYILEYDSLVNGYNLTINTEIGGDNWQGRRDTEQYREFVKKMKIINSGENNGMFGRSHRKNSIGLMKEKAKGRFSLPWYIERYGQESGAQKYEERCLALKRRNLKKDTNGRFTKE